MQEGKCKLQQFFSCKLYFSCAISLDEEKLERDHWTSVMQTLLRYQDFVSAELSRRQSHINKLPMKIADRLPAITFEKMNAIFNAAAANQELCTCCCNKVLFGGITVIVFSVCHGRVLPI